MFEIRINATFSEREEFSDFSDRIRISSDPKGRCEVNLDFYFILFVTGDHTTCDSCADSTSPRSWCCGSYAFLQIKAFLPGSSRTLYLHRLELF